jgi:putative membrane protein
MGVNRTATLARSALAALALTLPACDDDDDDDAPQFAAQDAAAPVDAEPQADILGDVAAGPVRTDGEVVGALTQANTGEVTVAQMAMTRAQNANVRDFANRLVQEHTAANMRLAALGIAATESGASGTLLADAQQHAATLAGTADAAFDQAFLESQVAMHSDVLKLIDSQLLLVAQSPQLQDEVALHRTMFGAHLLEAERLVAPGRGVTP